MRQGSGKRPAEDSSSDGPGRIFKRPALGAMNPIGREDMLLRECCATVAHAVARIREMVEQRGRPRRFSGNELNKMCYAAFELTQSSLRTRVVDFYQAELRSHIAAFTFPTLRANWSCPAEMLHAWTNVWRQYMLLVRLFAAGFAPVDSFTQNMRQRRAEQSYLKSVGQPEAEDSRELLSVTAQAYVIFDVLVFQPYQSTLVEALLGLVDLDRRQGIPGDRVLWKAVVTSIQCLDAWIPGKEAPKQNDPRYAELEAAVLRQAKEFYKAAALSYPPISYPPWLIATEQALREERRRCSDFMEERTVRAVELEASARLFRQHLPRLLSAPSGLEQLINNVAVEDLFRLFSLCGLSDDDRELRALAAQFQTLITAQGKKVAAADVQIRQLLDLLGRCSYIAEKSFKANALCQAALKRAFTDIANCNTFIPRHLGGYTGQLLMRANPLMLSEAEILIQTQRAVALYGYLLDKDVFEFVFQSGLESRLLSDQCRMELERQAIVLLKTEAGCPWTNRLENMFKEMELSKDLTKEWLRLPGQSENPDSPTVQFKVCGVGCWPAGSKPSPSLLRPLPEQLQRKSDHFIAFYMSKHVGRRLVLAVDQGQAEVRVQFSPGVGRTLVVSTVQMLVISAFNLVPTQKVLVVADVIALTGLRIEDMADDLLSLCHPKVAVLRKNPNTLSLSASDRLMINTKYCPATFKVVIPRWSLTSAEENGGAKGLEKHVENARRQLIEASLVRIMKTRKRMRHSDLVADVVAQLSSRFSARPGNIKRAIEALIDREYMERDAQDRNVYQYLA